MSHQNADKINVILSILHHSIFFSGQDRLASPGTAATVPEVAISQGPQNLSLDIALQTQSFLLAELKAQKKENKTQKELIEQQKKEIEMLCSRQQAGNLLFLNHIDKNCFFEFYKVKIWYQPHKKWGTGWVGGWMGGRAGFKLLTAIKKLV